MGKHLKHYSDYINERRHDDDEEELAQFTTSDGWDERQLDDVGLIDLFGDISKVIYEIKNARRGSYAKFGDTPQDLAYELINLGKRLDQAAKEIEETVDQHENFLKRKRR